MQVPGTWSEALEILQNNYANSLVMQALADARMPRTISLLS